ncbi:MAG: redoxin domain-containing protein [bacterium]|nr:redoxin domain-containing protein [bacterium]
MEEITVGMKAPDFSLNDFRGNPFTLSDHQGRNKVMLVLLRGFGCRNSQWHLDSLRNDYLKFRGSNAVVAAVGQHSRGEFSNIWKTFSLPFLGLPDDRGKVAQLYRQKVVFEKLGRLPAIFIVDPLGFVSYAHYCADIFDFPTNEKLLPILADKYLPLPPSPAPAYSRDDSPVQYPLIQGRAAPAGGAL